MKRKPRVAAETVESLQTKLLRAVSAEYPSDPTSPGIVSALLTNGQFYVSVCRYNGTFGAGKVVVAKGRGETLLLATKSASQEWLAAHLSPARSGRSGAPRPHHLTLGAIRSQAIRIHDDRVVCAPVGVRYARAAASYRLRRSGSMRMRMNADFSSAIPPLYRIAWLHAISPCGVAT